MDLYLNTCSLPNLVKRGGRGKKREGVGQGEEEECYPYQSLSKALYRNCIGPVRLLGGGSELSSRTEASLIMGKYYSIDETI